MLHNVLAAIRFAPSSYGLQPYHVVMVTHPDLRIRVREVAFDQVPVTEASHLLVFCTRTDGLRRIDQYVEAASGENPGKAEKLTGYGDVMRKDVGKKSPEQFKAWADRQTYLALGFALAACAELGLDSAPMEGFKPSEVNRILELPDHLKSVVLLCVGYRSHDPERKKVRFPEEDLFERR